MKKNIYDQKKKKREFILKKYLCTILAKHINHLFNYSPFLSSITSSPPTANLIKRSRSSPSFIFLGFLFCIGR